MRFVFGILLCGLFVQGCKSTDAEQPPPSLTEAEQQKVDEMRAEIEIGRGMAGRLLSIYQPHSDKKLVSYVNLVGNFVGASSEVLDRRYMFQVTTDSQITAYSCPGGYIVISEAAVKFAKNEAELAGVLAHEVAHVDKKHILDALKKKPAEQAAKEAEAGESVQARKRVKADADSKGSSQFARYLSGPGGTSLSFVMAAAGGLSMLLEEGLDHELEFAADAEALKTVAKAGYDPQAYVDYMERLSQQDLGVAYKVMKKTHPSFADRLDRLRTQVAELQQIMPAGALANRRFVNFTGKVTDVPKSEGEEQQQ